MAATISSRLSSAKIQLKEFLGSAREIYCKYDHRSLALARIGLGILFLHNVWRRVPGITHFYSNDGVLPNHTVLWRPTIEYTLTLFTAASRSGEAAVMFAVCAAIFLAFTLGYRTRFFHVLSFICNVMLQTRVAFTMNGGDVALDVLAAWTMFLPMGARFSIDAMRQSLAARREKAVAELNDRAAFPPPITSPAASLAFFAILLELAIIYYFNAVNKHGWTWRRGLAIHYVLYQERMVTWFGLWARAHVSIWISKFCTYFTMGLEYLAPVWLLTPVGRLWTRRLAILFLPFMHIGFAAGLNVGQFSFNMIGFFPLLLSSEDWEWFGKHLAPSLRRARTVYVPEGSALGFAWARVLSRLDRFDRLRFVSGAAWEVEDPATQRRTTGMRALAECVAALPAGVLVAFVFRLPGVRHLGDVLGRAIARRESLVARALRLPAPGAALPSDRGPSPARQWFRRYPLTAAREMSAVVLLYCCINQLLVQNFAIPQKYKPQQPKWITQLIWYSRLDQGWQMFSPDVPTSEKHLYVDAITFGGRHVDPYNELASRVAPLPMERIPPHLEQDEFWCDYEREIFGNEPYWRALKEWIFNYHRRTGKPEDRVISFEAKIIEVQFPPPHETEQQNITQKVMFSGRE